MIKDYKYIVISKTYVNYMIFPHFCNFLIVTSECPKVHFVTVEVHIKVGFKGVYIARTCFPDADFGIYRVTKETKFLNLR